MLYRFAAQAQIDMSKSTETQQQIYVLQMQINESTRMLARPDLGIPANPRDRSPSPEPVYNSSGKLSKVYFILENLTQFKSFGW